HSPHTSHARCGLPGGLDLPCGLQRSSSRLDLHASYKVAKKVVEFEYQEEIPRQRLRAAYGDGFKGAPLRCQSSGEGMFPQDTGIGDGTAPQAQTPEDKRIGGSSNV